ncbi:MAG: hypothetical protein WEB94_00165 [Candidatus Paceibacterota bacterium]
MLILFLVCWTPFFLVFGGIQFFSMLKHRNPEDRKMFLKALWGIALIATVVAGLCSPELYQETGLRLEIIISASMLYLILSVKNILELMGIITS